MSSGAILSQLIGPVVVLGAVWLTPSLTAPTLPFGVRVPAAHTGDPVIVEQRRAYRRLVGVGGGAIALTGIAVGAALDNPLVPVVTLLALLALAVAALLRARAAIRAVKAREAWYAGLRQAVAVDTALRTRPERFPWLWAAPAVLVVACTGVATAVRYPSMPDRLPTHYGRSGTVDHWTAKSAQAALVPFLIELGLTVVLMTVTRLIFNTRADLDPARPAGSALQHRRFLTRVSIALLVLTACGDLTVLVAGWQIWSGATEIAPAATLAPVLLGLAWLLGVAIASGQNGSRIRVDESAEQPRTDVVHQDDDRQWRAGGLVYLNRQDPAVLVPKRFGVGWTINLGNPRALLLIALIIGFPLAVRLLVR